MYPDGKYVFLWIQRRPTLQKTTQQLLAEFLFPADWPTYSPDLNSVDLSICSVLQLKGKATPHANLTVLRPSIAAELDQLAVV
jgi:hypothetical protein